MPNLPTSTPITDQVYGDGALYGINAWGDWLGLGTNARQAEYNERMVQQQMQREDTVYQRAVADMRAAGLNPALMYSNGGQAPASASASAGGSGNTSGGALASLIASASRLINSEALENTMHFINPKNTNAMSLNKAPSREVARLRQQAIKAFLKL